MAYSANIFLNSGSLNAVSNFLTSSGVSFRSSRFRVASSMVGRRVTAIGQANYFPRSRFGTFSRPIATALRDVRRLTGCPRWITRGPRPVPSRSRARSARCDAATRGCASCSGRRSSAESKIRSRCRSPISRSFGRSRLADWLEVCGKQPDASFGEFPYPSSCHIAGTRLALSHRPPGCFAPQTVSRGCGN